MKKWELIDKLKLIHSLQDRESKSASLLSHHIQVHGSKRNGAPIIIRTFNDIVVIKFWIENYTYMHIHIAIIINDCVFIVEFIIIMH